MNNYLETLPPTTIYSPCGVEVAQLAVNQLVLAQFQAGRPVMGV